MSKKILGISGSRNFNNYEKFKTFIKNNVDFPIACLVSGGCKGTDQMAERYAKEIKVPIRIHFPEWEKYGKAAGPIRNKKIVQDSHVMIAFLAKKSKGTKNTIKIANKMNKEVIICEI